MGRGLSDGYIYAGLAPSPIGTMGRGPRIEGICYRSGRNDYADVAAAIVLNSADSGNGECKGDDFEWSMEEEDTSKEVDNIIENLNEDIPAEETEEETIPILGDKDEEERTLVE